MTQLGMKWSFLLCHFNRAFFSCSSDPLKVKDERQMGWIGEKQLHAKNLMQDDSTTLLAADYQTDYDQSLRLHVC